MLRPSNETNSATAGFTLIEMLVALVLIATVLSSITALIASTARASRSIEGFLPLLSAARGLITALPDRGQIVSGDLSGTMYGQHWRLHMTPFVTSDMEPRTGSRWVPELIVMTIQTKNATKQFSTIRLKRRSNRQ